MKSASDSISPVDNYVWTFTNKGRHSTKNAAILVLLISCSSAVTLIVMYKHSKWHVLLCQRLTNSVSKSLLFSTMLQSWMWFMYLYGHQIKGLSVFKDFLHFKSTVVSTAYMPFVDIGYYAFGIMGVLYLVEFPFLLWYISYKVMGMDRRGLNRKQCMLNMMKSVGCAGMVLFMQVASWYLVYAFICFLAYPLLVIVLLGGYLTLFILLTASTALLLLPCLAGCKRCPQQSVPLIFLILIASICGGFTSLLANVIQWKWDTSYNSNQIISGIFASGLFALLVYAVKSVYTQYMLTGDPQVGTGESDERTPLVETLP